MKLKNDGGLHDTQQRALGALDRLSVQPDSTVEQAERPMYFPSLGKVDGAEADVALQHLLDKLGLDDVRDVLDVTQSDCVAKADGDSVEGVALFALAIALKAYINPERRPKKLARRTTPLAPLNGTVTVGRFQGESKLVALISLKDVSPSTSQRPVKIFVVGRDGLNAGEPIEVPVDASAAVDGHLQFALDASWMKKVGITPGSAIKVWQAQTDEDGKPVRTPSEPSFLHVNLGKTSANPDATQVVGSAKVSAQFATQPRQHLAQLNPIQMSVGFDGDHFTLDQHAENPGIEPYAEVALENLRTGHRSPSVTVSEEGALSVSVPAEAGDPVLIRVAAHGHKIGDPFQERRLVSTTSEDEYPLLIDNPALGIDAPPSIAVNRASLDPQCEYLRIDQGATPGSIVRLTQVGGDKEGVGLVDENGTARLRLPFEAHADDLFEVEISNAFSVATGIGNTPEKRDEWQTKARSKAQLQIGEDGSLALTGSEGLIHANLEDPVAMLDNVDRVKSAAPKPIDPKYRIKGFQVRFTPEDGNTGQYATINVGADSRVVPQAKLTRDGKTMVVTLQSGARGGWPTKTAASRPNVGWGKFGSTAKHPPRDEHWSSKNRHVGTIRQPFFHRNPKQNGERIKVRFQDEHGKVFATGEMVMTAEWVHPPGRHGAQGSHYTKHAFNLDAASLKYTD